MGQTGKESRKGAEGNEAKNWVLCPSDSEAAPFLADMEGVTETRKAMLRFYEGTFHGVDVVTLFSGVCKVNAALPPDSH